MTNRWRAASFAVCVVLGCCEFICGQGTVRPAPDTSILGDQDRGLRGVFLGTEIDPARPKRVVGRLAILLKTDEGMKRVRQDYSFHGGDRFRFDITSDRDGWLYVMHAAPDGSLQQLWPTKASGEKISAKQSYEVPPRPGIFVFDKDTGNEVFYVLIRSDRTPPKFNESTPRKDSDAVITAKNESKTSSDGKIKNFVVRDPFGESTRGVVFDPGEDDPEPYLYFSAEGTNNAKVMFQLHHID